MAALMRLLTATALVLMLFSLLAAAGAGAAACRLGPGAGDGSRPPSKRRSGPLLLSVSERSRSDSEKIFF